MRETSVVCPEHAPHVTRRHDTTMLRYRTPDGRTMHETLVGVDSISAQIILDEFYGRSICALPAAAE